MGIYEVRRYCEDCQEWRVVKAAQKSERNPNVKCRRHSRKRDAAPAGSRIAHQTGYVLVRTESGWEYEHRVVWRSQNGPIPDGFHVHHRNHVRDDNRIENLQLVDGSIHNRNHTNERHRAGLFDATGARSSKWLRELDDAEIVRRHDAGESFRSIASAMGVSHPTIAHHYRLASGRG